MYRFRGLFFMKKYLICLFGLLGICFTSCHKEDKDTKIVSQRHVHKYGYAVSKEEWDSNFYPGQVITTLEDGVTITATYDHGVLHGPCTYTFPHSQTTKDYYYYNDGVISKEIHYDERALPVKEVVHLSPTRKTYTFWFESGSPERIEEYAGNELTEGRYYNTNNETESRVEKGFGVRILRDQKGALVSKEVVDRGLTVKKESFFSNGMPESVSFYKDNNLHGTLTRYAQTGEPVAVEEWIHGKLHGKCTYFKNGVKTHEISYLDGAKNGYETHYIDGEKISQQVQWENDLKHGPSTFYVDDVAHTEWFYEGTSVPFKKFRQLQAKDQMISQISSDVRIDNAR